MEPFGKSEAHRTGVDVSEIKEKVNEPDLENHSELNPGRSRITRQKKVDKSSTSTRVQRRRALSSANGDSDQEQYLLHRQYQPLKRLMIIVIQAS